MMEENIKEKIDLRGVSCPMSYVKIVMVLEELVAGDRVEAILDGGDPIRNVPRTAVKEGHKVVATAPVGDAYRVVIEKG